MCNNGQYQKNSLYVEQVSPRHRNMLTDEASRIADIDYEIPALHPDHYGGPKKWSREGFFISF